MTKYSRQLFMRASQDSGGILTLIAQKLNVEPLTVRNWALKYPEVRERLQEERSKIIDVAEHGLFSLLREKDKWAIGFVLRTIGKDRGYVERQEIEQRDATPVMLVFDDADGNNNKNGKTTGSVALPDRQQDD